MRLQIKNMNVCMYGKAPPRGPTPFFTKKVPLMHTFYKIDKWYPFHILCLELCIPFNCCKCTVF